MDWDEKKFLEDTKVNETRFLALVLLSINRKTGFWPTFSEEKWQDNYCTD